MATPSLPAVRERRELERLADEQAARYGIPRALFRELVTAESDWDVDVESPAGALGLGQLMPGTARALGVDPLDPEQNLEGAARYLRSMFDRFGRWDYALAAYNAGPGNVQRYGGIPPFAETRAYVTRILSRSSSASRNGGGPGALEQALTAGAAGPGGTVLGLGNRFLDSIGGYFNPVDDITGAVSEAWQGLVLGLFRIVIVGVILALAAALFYNGVRRLSGDRLPSPTDLGAVAMRRPRAGARRP